MAYTMLVARTGFACGSGLQLTIVRTESPVVFAALDP